MAIFKRIEVWILLVLLLGGAAWVIFTQGGGSSGGAPAGAAAAGAENTKLKVERLELTRDYGNGKLDITVSIDNRDGSEIGTTPPDTRLVSAEGGEVDAFFLAGVFPAPIPAGREAEVTLSFWLKPEHFDGALELWVLDEQVTVKSAAPFDLESLENQESKKLQPTGW